MCMYKYSAPRALENTEAITHILKCKQKSEAVAVFATVQALSVCVWVTWAFFTVNFRLMCQACAHVCTVFERVMCARSGWTYQG